MALELVDEFIGDVFAEYPEREVEEICSYAKMVICPDYYNPQRRKSSYESSLRILNDCIYAFKKETYERLINQREYCLMFKHYIESGDFDILKETDATMARNSKVYTIVSKEIYRDVLEELS